MRVVGIAIALCALAALALAGQTDGEEAYVEQLWKSPDLNHGGLDETYGLAVADHDGDGTLDIWAGDDNSTVRVFSGRDHHEIVRYQLSVPGYLVNAVEVVDLGGNGKPEVVMGLSGGGIWEEGGYGIIDVVTGAERRIDTSLGPVNALAVGDIDRDGDRELVLAVSGYEAHVVALSGPSLTEEWHTPEQQGNLMCLRLRDVGSDFEVWAGIEVWDFDSGLEYFGEIQVFAGDDGTLLRNRTDFQEPVLSLDFTDDDILVGTGEMGDTLFDENGQIHHIYSNNLSDKSRSGDLNVQIYALQQINLNGGEPELVIGASYGALVFGARYQELWSMWLVGNGGVYGNLWVGDIDDDLYLDFIIHVSEFTSTPDWHEKSFVFHYRFNDQMYDLDHEPEAVVVAPITDYSAHGLTVSWSRYDHADFDHYELHLFDTNGFEPTNDSRFAILITPEGTTYELENLQENTTYFCLVRVYNTAGRYNDSNIRFVTLRDLPEDSEIPGFAAPATLAARRRRS